MSDTEITVGSFPQKSISDPEGIAQAHVQVNRLRVVGSPPSNPGGREIVVLQGSDEVMRFRLGPKEARIFGALFPR